MRDILAMGARPIALLNSLRFGPLDDARNRYLFDGVVGGISWYGNCIGIPDVGGEVCFSHSYSGNPLGERNVRWPCAEGHACEGPGFR